MPEADPALAVVGGTGVGVGGTGVGVSVGGMRVGVGGRVVVGVGTGVAVAGRPPGTRRSWPTWIMSSLPRPL